MIKYGYSSRDKKITCPGARDKLNFRQDKHIFSPNVRWTSKKLNASIFFLDKDKLFGNRTSKNFDGLARGTSENLNIFLPLSSQYHLRSQKLLCVRDIITCISSSPRPVNNASCHYCND